MTVLTWLVFVGFEFHHQKYRTITVYFTAVKFTCVALLVVAANMSFFQRTKHSYCYRLGLVKRSFSSRKCLDILFRQTLKKRMLTSKIKLNTVLQLIIRTKKRWCVLKQKKILFSDGCWFLDFATVDGLGCPTFVHFLNSLRICTSKLI